MTVPSLRAQKMVTPDAQSLPIVFWTNQQKLILKSKGLFLANRNH